MTEKVEATVAGVTYTVPVETIFGGYIKSYNKITDNRDTTDKAAYNDFTSNGAYIKEVGFQIKLDTLVAQSTIANDGWYTSSNLSGIPSDAKNRLFKVKVATEVDSNITPSYGVKVSGSYYMTPETYQKSETLPYVIYTESASYIIRVDEAVSVAKLKKDSLDSYDTIHASEPLFREKIAYETVHLISDNETYIKNAKQYFVNKAQLSFHDDYVYDYFADTFPDLFESND